MRNLLLSATLGVALIATTTTACSPRLARTVFAAAVLTAVIVGTAHVLAHHDAHFHDEYCGHHRRWHDGRWVYYYEERWEYYDPDTGRWYYYSDPDAHEEHYHYY
jgi:hypothetical protein